MVLSTLLHEIHHNYEHRLVDVYNSVSTEYRDLHLFRDASQYSHEVDYYINPREDYFGYMSQYLEMDSENTLNLVCRNTTTELKNGLNKMDCYMSGGKMRPY